MHIIHDTNRFCDELYPMQTTSVKRLVLKPSFYPSKHILVRKKKLKLKSSGQVPSNILVKQRREQIYFVCYIKLLVF